LSGQLLIVGSMRSGTTLLNRLLHAHPQVAMIYHPTRFFESEKDLRDLGAAGFLEKFKGSYGYFGNLDPPTRARCESALAGLSEAAAKGDIYRALTAALVDDPAAKVIGEKYAGRGAEMRPFHALVPDGKVLMIVRDPRDVLLSNKKRIEQEADMENYWAGSHLMVLDDWAQLAVLHRSFDQIQSGLYSLVRYEDLVSAPEAALRRICDFLGLPYAAEMLREGALRHDDGRQWRANTSHGEAYLSVSDESVGTYRGGLTSGELLCLNVLLREQIRFFGYSPDPPVTETDVLAEACEVFLALGRILKRYAVPDPRLYDVGRSEADNLRWFVEKLVVFCGLEAAPFLKGFLTGRAVTVKSAGTWMETVTDAIAAEVVALRRSFEWMPAALHEHSEDLGREIRNLRAAVDRLPTFLNVVKRAIRKPPQ
jgi:hypothetical protein